MLALCHMQLLVPEDSPLADSGLPLNAECIISRLVQLVKCSEEVVLVHAAAMFLMWEVSTPCVYVRWFLYNLGKHDTKAYIFNGMAMLATFFFCRNVLGFCAPPSLCGLVLLHPWYLLMIVGGVAAAAVF